MISNYEHRDRAPAAREAHVSTTRQDDARLADEAEIPPAQTLREYDTASLFAGAREIVIHHAGAAYRMKITKQGKLILNK